MPYSISLPRAISALSLLTLVSSGCSCDGERARVKAEAKARVGARVEASPARLAANERIDVDALASDRKALSRVWEMSWREAQLRLADHHVWQGQATLSYGKVDGKQLGIDEEAEIRSQSGTGSLDVSVSNDGGFFQRIVYSNGRLYRKYQNGNYVASKDLEAKRLHYADEAYALGGTGWNLIGRLITLKKADDKTLVGRTAACFALRKAAAPAAFESSSLKGALSELKGWRASLVLDSVDGTLCVDRSSGVLLSVRMSARATRPLKDGEGELKLSVNAGFVSISSAPTINAPEEFLKTLRRSRRDRPGTSYLKDRGIKVLERPDAGLKNPKLK